MSTTTIFKVADIAARRFDITTEQAIEAAYTFFHQIEDLDGESYDAEELSPLIAGEVLTAIAAWVDTDPIFTLD